MATSPSIAALLLLADGRLPTGGHAHSAGVEAAVAAGAITDEDGLADYLAGRLATTGLQEAALAAATVRHVEAAAPADRAGVLDDLDAEADARQPVLPLRDASRRLGRQLVRVASRCWPDPVFAELTATCRGGAHQAVALGVVGVAAGLGGEDIAWVATHHAIAMAAQAGVRLLGLDPFAVAAVTAALAPDQAAVVAEAVAAAHGALADLPARAGPLADLRALDHRTWDARLFAT